MKTQIKTRRTTITPTMAAQLLAEHNPHNRALSKPTVKRYAKLMSEGKWQLNGGSIKRDTNGNILDGQHSLAACVEADVPFETFVTEGLDPEVFDTIDTGKPRSAADALFAGGMGTNARLVAAVANMAIKLEQGTLRRNRYIEPHQVRQWVQDNPDVLEAVEKVKAMSPLGFAPVLGLAYFLAKRSAPDKAETFFTALETGENLHKGDPAYTLRETLIRHRSDRSYHKADVLAMAAKAWNFFIQDKKLTSLSKGRTGGLAFS